MTQQYLCQLSLTILCTFVWHPCYGLPTLINSNRDIVQQSDIVNVYLKYLTTNTNVFVTMNNSNGACPWKYVSDHNINRFPVSIMSAQLTVDNNRCFGVKETYNYDYLCDYIYRTVQVLEKNCTFCPYQKKEISVRIGAKCISVRSSNN